MQGSGKDMGNASIPLSFDGAADGDDSTIAAAAAAVEFEANLPYYSDEALDIDDDLYFVDGPDEEAYHPASDVVQLSQEEPSTTTRHEERDNAHGVTSRWATWEQPGAFTPSAHLTRLIAEANTLSALKQVVDEYGDNESNIIQLNLFHISGMLTKLASIVVQLRRIEQSGSHSASSSPSLDVRNREPPRMSRVVRAETLESALQLSLRLVALIPPFILDFDARGVCVMLRSLADLFPITSPGTYRLDMSQGGQTAEPGQSPHFHRTASSSTYGYSHNAEESELYEEEGPGLGPGQSLAANSLQTSPSNPSALISSNTSTQHDVSALYAVLPDLMFVSVGFMPEMAPGSLSSLAYSAAQLGLVPDEEWILNFVRFSSARVDKFGPRDLSDVVWALAKIGAHHRTIGRPWFSKFYKRCIQVHEIPAKSLSTITWSLVKLRHKPPPYFTSHLAQIAQPRMRSFSPAGLVTFLRGLVHLKTELSDEWLDAAVEQGITPRLRSFSPSTVCKLWITLASLDSVRIQEHHSESMHNIQLRIKSFASKLSPESLSDGLSNMMWALARVFVFPSRMFMFKSLTLSQVLANMMWALARVFVFPSRMFIRVFMETTFGCLQEFNAHELSSTLWALAVLRKHPDAMWMERFESASMGCMAFYSTQNLADTAWALSSFRYKPGSSWCSRYKQRLWKVRCSLQDEHVIELVCALPFLGIQPDPVLVKEVMININRSLQYYPPDTIRELLMGITALDLASAQWLKLVATLLRSHFSGMDPHGLVDILCCLTGAGFRPGPDWLREFEVKLGAHIRITAAPDLCRAIAAFASLGHNPGQDWLDQAVGKVLDYGLINITAVDLISLIQGLAGLGYSTETELLKRFSGLTPMGTPETKERKKSEI
eukprot:gene14553-20594_t